MSANQIDRGAHPVWVVRGEGLDNRPKPVRIPAYEAGSRLDGRWVLARDLRAGDEVVLRDDRVVSLEAVVLADVTEPVYNFHVAELQNYAVGGIGVLVHNTNDPQAPPPLKPLHKDSTLRPSSLDYWRKKSTQEIIDSLKPGAKEPLTTYPDGTVAQGHHRLKVLRERGCDVDKLPREIHKPDRSMFPDLD